MAARYIFLTPDDIALLAGLFFWGYWPARWIQDIYARMGPEKFGRLFFRAQLFAYFVWPLSTSLIFNCVYFYGNLFFSSLYKHYDGITFYVLAARIAGVLGQLGWLILGIIALLKRGRRKRWKAALAERKFQFRLQDAIQWMMSYGLCMALATLYLSDEPGMVVGTAVYLIVALGIGWLIVLDVLRFQPSWGVGNGRWLFFVVMMLLSIFPVTLLSSYLGWRLWRSSLARISFAEDAPFIPLPGKAVSSHDIARPGETGSKAG